MYRFEKEQEQAIVTGLREVRCARMYKKLKILEGRMRGIGVAQLAHDFGVSECTVTRLCKNYSKNGWDALVSKYTGRAGKVSLEEAQKVLDDLAVSASEGRYLRTADLQKAFEEATGVRYHQNAFYKLLDRHNWRKVMPRQRHPKGADEAACDAAKKLTIL